MPSDGTTDPMIRNIGRRYGDSPHRITEDKNFTEALGQIHPTLPERLRSFMADLEALNVESGNLR